MGLSLKCDKRALIPRFDTETVCEAALVCIEGKRAPRVLDMCTGSGALGLAIAHFRPDAQVTLSDISEDALALAAALSVDDAELDDALPPHATSPIASSALKAAIAIPMSSFLLGLVLVIVHLLTLLKSSRLESRFVRKRHFTQIKILVQY